MKNNITSCTALIPAVVLAGFGKAQMSGEQHVIAKPLGDCKGARHVRAADIDGDGDLDLVTSSWVDRKVAWYENLGGGHFAYQQIITTDAGQGPGVELVDIDKDGAEDLLLSNRSFGYIAWCANLGSGSFGQQQVITTVTNGASDISGTDLDGDGDPDVLFSSHYSDSVVWCENLGSGSFGPQQVISSQADGFPSVHTADLDGDGDRDVLSASTSDDKVAWYENQGGGVFGTQQIISTVADHPVGLHSADLDGDGDEDVLSASGLDDKIAWYENQGGGVFGPQQVITTQADWAEDVYTADLDGDGDADVLSASSNDDKIAWYENLGGGVFGLQQEITTLAQWALEVRTADLDGDGDEDVLSVAYHGDEIAWYENLGGGVIGNKAVVNELPAANSVRSVQAKDLDGDGDEDVLSASAFDDKVAWYENEGGGVFGTQQIISTLVDYPVDVHLADLDGDGDEDALSASSGDNKIAWYENVGGGMFGVQQVITTLAYSARDVHTADLDGDGDLDVLSAYSDRVVWYENQGGGSFGSQSGQVVTMEADGPRSVHAADLDGDGDADVLSASFYDDKVAWYENLGGGIFSPQKVVTTLADGAIYVCAEDLDGDVDKDVLSYSLYDQKVAWYENLGDGSFAAQQVIESVFGDLWGCDRLVVVDLNGDGLVDLVLTNYFAITWVQGLGGGQFGPQTVVSEDVYTATGVAVADLDLDGDQDVLSSSRSDDKVAWYENLFDHATLYFMNPATGRWYREYNGDGASVWSDADAFARSMGGQLVTVRNQAENDWLSDTFSGDGSFFWIGYHDSNVEGQFEWSSGETPGYENWRNGEPDDNLGADYAVLVPGAGTWMDEPYLPERRFVVEWIPGDCNENGIPDAYEASQDPSMDWNGDGQFDDCVSANYCSTNPNSTGAAAVIGASGSPVVADNAFTLEGWDLPQNQFGYFLASESTTFVPGFGGSDGSLCVGAPQYRFNNPSDGGQVLNSGGTGTMSFTLDLDGLPQGITFDSGETWYFQLWFRDFTTGPTSNTTDGIEVMFR